MNNIVAETYTLPSKGLIYTEKVVPEVRITSMTTTDEMKRLSRSDRTYQTLCDIIDSRLIDPVGISAYDMCLGDYAFLLHKLRVVTYGPTYSLASVCPYCGFKNTATISLDDFTVNDFKMEDIEKYSKVPLPVSNHVVKIQMQTPRLLDDIQVAIEAEKKRYNEAGITMDPTVICNLKYTIQTIDNEIYDPLQKEEFIKNLPMKDTATILAYSKKLNDIIGMDLSIQNSCDMCGYEFKSSFTIGPEFFRPTLDI